MLSLSCFSPKPFLPNSLSNMFSVLFTELAGHLTYLPTSSDHLLRQCRAPSHTKVSAISGQVSTKKLPTKRTQAYPTKAANGPRRRHIRSKQAPIVEPQSQISQAPGHSLSDRDLLTFERKGHLITKAFLSQEETSLLGQVSLHEFPPKWCFYLEA